MPHHGLPDERLPDERLPDERLSDERLPDERLPDERLSDHRLSDERLSHVWLPHHGLPDERLPHRGLPDHHGHRGGLMRSIPLFVLSIGAWGCGPGEEPEAGGDSAGQPAGEPGPGAFAGDFETSEDFFTRMSGPVDGGSVHGTVQIWYSANLREAVESGQPFVAPEGSVAIKVQDNGAPAITVMVKREPGFDPDGSDWSYEQRTPEGELVNEGPLQGCKSCHSGFPDTDYLGGTELR